MDKITLLKSTKSPDGSIRRRVLYWYDIAGSSGGVIKDSTGTTIPPQTQADLPEDAARYASQADKTAIDNGNAGFEVWQRDQLAGQSAASLVALLLVDRTARETWWIQDMRNRYGQSGQGAN